MTSMIRTVPTAGSRIASLSDRKHSSGPCFPTVGVCLSFPFSIPSQFRNKEKKMGTLRQWRSHNKPRIDRQNFINKLTNRR